MLIYPSLRGMVYFYQVPSGGLLTEAEVFGLPDRSSLDAPAFYDVLDQSVIIHRNADEFTTGLRYTVKDTDNVRFRISFFTYVWRFVLYLRYGNVEIKKQTQIFVTVSYYFRMQV